jgi:hypothetical protein
VILMELLSGARLSANEPVAATRPSVRGLPRGLAELLAQMLARAPEDRPSIERVHEVLSSPDAARSPRTRPAVLVGGATASAGLAWLLLTAFTTPGEAARGARGGFEPEDLANGQDVAEPSQGPPPRLEAPLEPEVQAPSASPLSSVRADPPPSAASAIPRPASARAAKSVAPPSEPTAPPLPSSVGIIEEPP